jgi:hypothetical protein
MKPMASGIVSMVAFEMRSYTFKISKNIIGISTTDKSIGFSKNELLVTPILSPPF